MSRKVRIENSIEYKRPWMLVEWNYCLNQDPSTVSASSSKYFTWTCMFCGESWTAKASCHTKPGCKKCQKASTSKRRSTPRLGHSLADLYPELVKNEWDKEANTKSPECISAHARYLAHWICPECNNHYTAWVYNRTGQGSGCPECKKSSISEKNRKPKPGTSLKEVSPSLADEWHLTKNGTLTPSDVCANSGIPVWWIGDCGHEYDMDPSHRMQGCGCPFCNGKRLLIGFNDLASVHPELVSEFDKEATGFSAEEVMAGSGKEAHWICPDCGNRYVMPIARRTSGGSGCPRCGRKKGARKMSATKRKSHDEFVAELEEKNPNVVAVGRYVKSSEKIRVKCVECGREWDAFPGNLLSGRACSACSAKRRRMSEEEFARRLSKVDETIKIVSEYTKSSDRLSFRCKVCGHEWETIGTSVLRGSGCIVCKNRQNGISKTKSHEQYVADVAESNQDIEVVGTYAGADEPIGVRCKKCGHEWSPTATKLVGATGCPNCAGNIRHTHAKFVSKMAEINPDIEVLGEYVRGKDRILVRCKKCNREWSPVASSLLSGAGCIVCAGTNRKTNEQFVDELSAVNPEIEPLEEYAGANHRIRFRCKRCGGTWATDAYNVLHGTGCPHCSTARRSFFEHVMLYALRDVLGKSKVKSRDKKTIGMELDIAIPSMGLAFEPGSWFYHQHRVEHDALKIKKCSEIGIKLEVIYFGFDDGDDVPDGCIAVRSSMGTQNWSYIKEFVAERLDANGIDPSCIDWDDVRTKAMRFTGRRSTESFSSELQEISPTIIVTGEYSGARERIDVECSVCGHTWSPSASSLLSGHGCPHCSRMRADRITTDDIKTELESIAPSLDVVGEYNNRHSTVRVKCKKCGREWVASIGNLRRGSLCAKCAGVGRKTHDEFALELSNKNPYVMPLDECVIGRSKIPMLCTICGCRWDAAPQDLLSGRGCPDCGKVKSAMGRRKTHEQFVSEVTERNPDVKVVGRYVGARRKIRFRCRKCDNEWYATPDNILRGRGCPKCRRRGRRRES